jgi:hypothetical protein
MHVTGMKQNLEIYQNSKNKSIFCLKSNYGQISGLGRKLRANILMLGMFNKITYS